MKKIMIFATALLLAWGCVNDVDENIAPDGTENESGAVFNVVASSADARTSYSEVDGVLKTAWKAADKIDVISVVDGTEYEALTYTADEAGTKVAFSPVDAALSKKEGAANYKFHAYYHYWKHNSGTSSISYTDGVPYLTCHMNGSVNNGGMQGAVDDNGTSRLYRYDVLWATPVEVADPAGNVDLDFTFNHAFAVLEFKLSTTGSENISVKKISVTGSDLIASDVKVNLTNGELTVNNVISPQVSNMNFNKQPVLTPGGDPYSCYMTILPGHADKKLTITITDNNDNTYTFEKTPSKAIAAGQRAVLPLVLAEADPAPTGVKSTTPEKLWSVNLTTLEGVNAANVSGLALSNGKLLLSEDSNSNPVYLNALTGEKEGTMDVSAVTAANSKYYATSDDAGNILFCNYWDRNGTTFSLYKAASVTDAPTVYTTRTIDNTIRTGYKISVEGSLNAAAMITTTELTAYASLYIRSWQVQNGALNAGTHFRNLGTMASGAVYGTRCDAIYAGVGGTNDIYFAHYAKYNDGSRWFKQFVWDASQNKPVEKAKVADDTNGQSIPTAVDYVEFNGAKYVFMNYVNSFTYKTNDVVRMYDVTSGDLSTATRTNVANNHVDGSVQVNGKQNTSIYGDVLAHVDGDYMYVYVMFANGNVSCYRYEAAK